MSSTDRKPGFFQKLFGRSKSSSEQQHQHHSSSPASNKKDKRHLSSSDDSSTNTGHHPKANHPPAALKIQTQTSARGNGGGPSPTKLSPPTTADGHVRPPSPRNPTAITAQTSRSGGSGKPKKGGKHRKRGNKSGGKLAGAASIDTRRPLEYPATPEMILAYHQARPFLDKNEEWLLVELNEYECLVDGIDIVRIIAKHSKFFEVEPDELWEEFFEYVDEISSYDEVINFDVWQEFRDNKYPC